MTTGFRDFRVAQKVTESDIITSFYLEPVDGAPVWEARPGQYLTLRVPTADGHLLKSYSVSGDAAQTSGYRITVKRETGLDGAPDGVGSCWLHDVVQVGDEIAVAAPRGTFYLDEESTRPVILLSGGVGLTPMVSMLHRLRETDRDVYFLHACEGGSVHALRDEVLGLATSRTKTLFVYRTPSAEDEAAQAFDAKGFIDKAFLQRHLPLDDYEVYLCGPTPFMVAMYHLLQKLGIPKSRIAYEFFGKGGSLDKVEEPTRSKTAASRAAPAIQALTFVTDPDAWASADETPRPVKATFDAVPDTPEITAKGDVVFRKSDASATWGDGVSSLLELAENAGIDPEFSCRTGICGACECRLISGEVEYTQAPLEEPEDGHVLICCTRPKGPVVLDI